MARAVIEGVPHHVTQRGNGQQIIFDTVEHRRLYLDLLRKYSERFRLSLWAYCLMSNHIHLIAVPHRPDSLGRALGRTHADYARYLNLCRRSSGHVFQARYFSCALGENHTWRAMAYVERNPTRAGLSSRATDYPWSSASTHVQENDPTGFLDLRSWQERYRGADWRSLLDLPSEDQAFQQRLQEATLRGRPYCDAETLQAFEVRLQRPLHPRPAGRPRRPAAAPPPLAREQAAGLGNTTG